MSSPVCGRALGECNAIRSLGFGLSELTFIGILETDFGTSHGSFPLTDYPGVSQLEPTGHDKQSSSMRDLGHEPGPGHLPIAHHALRGNLQHFCRFLHAEASEKSELDDLGFAGVDQR